MGKTKLSTPEFVQKSISIHGSKYDYSLVEYFHSQSKVKIICPVHGVFEQTPSGHTNNKLGCLKCKTFNKLTTKDFIEKAVSVHGSKYDYSLVEYTHSQAKVKIICKEHGVFEQTPFNHLRDCGCPTCGDIVRLAYHYTFLNSLETHKELQTMEKQ